MSEPTALPPAIQRLNPVCPNCGALPLFPRVKGADGRSKWFGEQSDCERTREYAITCASCKTAYRARFFESQEAK